MDSRGTDRIEELPVADTPEDVAVLYSWANLHGAKYRDFSASRREYRAQLRHRAAEQVREQELKAQAEAEAAASTADAVAEAAAMQAESSVPLDNVQADSLREQALREADRASRIASAERVEAARRAEAAAVAEAAARKAEREIAEASASARRQASRYTDSEIRHRESGVMDAFLVPGETSDPYTPIPQQNQRPVERSASSRNLARVQAGEDLSVSRFQGAQYPSGKAVTREEYLEPEFRVAEADAIEIEAFERVVPEISPAPVVRAFSARRQGYRPDDASGVRQIYRAPEFDEPSGAYVAAESVRPPAPVRTQMHMEAMRDVSPTFGERTAGARLPVAAAALPPTTAPEGNLQGQDTLSQAVWPFAAIERTEVDYSPRPSARRESAAGTLASQRGTEASRATPPPALRQPSPYGQPATVEAARGRRAQDDAGFQAPAVSGELNRRSAAAVAPLRTKASGAQRPVPAADPAGPAWLYAPQTPTAPVRLASPVLPTPAPQSSVADTLQHSRERVAARWFALKGVFEQPGQDQPETPIRQKEIRTPVLAIFSLAGGVGKTSLVATLGRALSSLGEKVLLTDTTSHGLLPFYFGASELRQGVVRTFSPPSGSTDAPIYLVSYEVDHSGNDDAQQEQLVTEITNNSKGMHRILLDLTPASGWVARRLAKNNPNVLVPLAPDMNSVISLQAVEKYFAGVIDSDGRPLQPYFLINQFDASLPLHLDVREVLRRQLGDRLLPFVIRRTPSVSEALAEGMTVMDYAPDAPIAEDYQNVAAWLRTIAAPATAGFRNVRWSER